MTSMLLLWIKYRPMFRSPIAADMMRSETELLSVHLSCLYVFFPLSLHRHCIIFTLYLRCVCSGGSRGRAPGARAPLTKIFKKNKKVKFDKNCIKLIPGLDSAAV